MPITNMLAMNVKRKPALKQLTPKPIPKLNWELVDRTDNSSPIYMAQSSLDNCDIEGRIFETSEEEICFDVSIRNLKTGVWATRGGTYKNLCDVKSQAQRTLGLLWKYRHDTVW